MFVELKRYDEAAAAYDKALAIDANLDELQGAYIHAKSHCCDWSNFDSDCSKLIDGIGKGLPVASPFAILGLPVTAEDQLKCARTFVGRTIGFANPPLWRGEIYSHDRIRIAYVSADFQDHATAHLMAGMLEHHDRTRFSTIAISLGANDGSAMRGRLTKAFGRFVDCFGKSDAEIAALMRDMEIDIAIDLKGYTQDSRPAVFAMRPAPVQVNYLGYPSTMGANFVDYLLAD